MQKKRHRAKEIENTIIKNISSSRIVIRDRHHNIFEIPVWAVIVIFLVFKIPSWFLGILMCALLVFDLTMHTEENADYQEKDIIEAAQDNKAEKEESACDPVQTAEDGYYEITIQ